MAVHSEETARIGVGGEGGWLVERVGGYRGGEDSMGRSGGGGGGV